MKPSVNASSGVSIRDIAARARLSKSTVSLALRGDPRITAKTRERVERAAGALGYRRDPLVGVWLSQMRRGGGRAYQSTLALLDGFQVRDEWRRYHSMKAIAAGAEAHARELGFGWEHHWLHDPGCPPARLHGVLRARGIQGLLLMTERDEVGFPIDEFALVNVKTLGSAYPASAANAPLLEERVCAALKERGYRRIGFIYCDYSHKSANGMNPSHWLIRITRGVMRIEKLTVRESGPFRFLEELAPVFWPWFRSYRPDVIVAPDAVMHDWLRGQGLRVPSDVGFALLDRDPADARFAGMDALHSLHGAAAIDLLVGQLQRGERGVREHPKRMFLEPLWVDGPSASGPDAAKNKIVRRRKGEGR